MKYPRVPLSQILSDVILACILGCFVALGYIGFSENQDEAINLQSLFLYLSTGGIIGTSIFIIERFILIRFFSDVNFLLNIFITTICYSTAILLWLYLLIFDEHQDFYSFSIENKFRFYFGQFSVKDLLFALFASFILTIILEIRSLLSPGFFRDYLTGRYFRSKEEFRIFMFIDLKSSTLIAEKLGHLQYSKMLKNCFSDLSTPVLACRAEVYQYVGDQVILTWPKHKGVKNAYSLVCFFMFCRTLKNKERYYLKQYGIIPEFKAAIHIGHAISTCVGDIKKEIVYHGDVLNATARMQSLCNEYSSRLIISDDLLQMIDIPKLLYTKTLGSVVLKGKSEPVFLYSVDFKMP